MDWVYGDRLEGSVSVNQAKTNTSLINISQISHLLFEYPIWTSDLFLLLLLDETFAADSDQILVKNGEKKLDYIASYYS